MSVQHVTDEDQLKQLKRSLICSIYQKLSALTILTTSKSK